MDGISELARAVLYEGYLLWPYRRSALKNQQRWTMGSVAPQLAGGSSTHTECLFEPEVDPVSITVTVRFLHIVDRQVQHDGQPVDEIRVDGQLHQTWEEATERENRLEPIASSNAVNYRLPLHIPAGHDDQQLDTNTAIRRSWHELTGVVAISIEPLSAGARKATVTLTNTTVTDGAGGQPHRLGFASAHLLLEISGGRFISAMDPPAQLRTEIANCAGDGLWPVLVGEPGEHTTMLAAPIVLYDWPQISPESPGDLFDNTEIDRLLVLNVLSMTAEEQEEMAAADPRAREILDRCSGLSTEELLQLHGTLRDVAKETW